MSDQLSLNIESKPLLAKCDGNGNAYKTEDNKLLCPYCTKLEKVTYDDLGFVKNLYCRSVIFPAFLVLRKNRVSGAKFWGCKNFPRCKYTISIKEKKYCIDYGDDLRPY